MFWPGDRALHLGVCLVSSLQGCSQDGSQPGPLCTTLSKSRPTLLRSGIGLWSTSFLALPLAASLTCLGAPLCSGTWAGQAGRT